ncbi:PepSY-associated TM helix domain-containing protein [uncultured Prevotella sp.]|uniref:PepSY domain-containing protein n=1 Tax=uncultured Prevotella sp. TaxID=159272 RepID=UPI0025E7D416|nr:PepSY-associated TM helix domain-containing protein [uncultured Prevotella sp.]
MYLPSLDIKNFVEIFRESEFLPKFASDFHELHIGSWEGMLTKIITFVVSLIGASLPITGYLLYFRRRCKA